MTTTTLNQTSSTSVDGNGNPRFRVTSTVTVVKDGDLPFMEIFVHQIIDKTDPKQDKFLRVANVHDLATLVRTRDTAILTEQTTFLAPSFSVEFSDVTTTTNAKVITQSRVDSLIRDWIKYTTELLIPENTALPVAVDSLVMAAKNAHKASKTTHTLKEAALVLANATLASATATATRASQDVVTAMARTNSCSLLNSNMTAFIIQYNSYKAAVAVVVDEGSFVDGISPNFDGAIHNMRMQQSNEAAVMTPLLTSMQATIAAECAAEQAAVQTAVVAKSTADAAVATAQTAQARAQAEATAASAAEAATLAAALELCPDYDPNE